MMKMSLMQRFLASEEYDSKIFRKPCKRRNTICLANASSDQQLSSRTKAILGTFVSNIEISRHIREQHRKHSWATSELKHSWLTRCVIRRCKRSTLDTVFAGEGKTKQQRALIRFTRVYQTTHACI